MEFLNSAWEVLIIVRDVLFYNKMLEEEIRYLKRYAEAMHYEEKDVKLALESLEKRLEKKRKREVDDWLEKVKRKRTEVDQREQEVRETRYFLRWRLLKRIQEDFKEMRELRRQGCMFFDLLTEDGSQEEVQQSGQEILEDVQAGSSASCRSPQYYQISDNQSLWEKLRISITKRLYYNKTLEEEIGDLKNDAEAMRNIEEDVKSALGSIEKRHGKKRKREVDDWLEKVQTKRTEVYQREQEVRESRYLWQWRLRRRIQKDVEEVRKLCEQGFFSDGLLTEDGSQGEVQQCSQEILEHVQAGSSESCRFPQYYWTSDDQSVEYKTLEEVQEDTEEVEASKLGISKGKGTTNLEPGTLYFQMASSSSTIDNSERDVFLSFRDEDTRYNFTSHLYHALCRANIKLLSDRLQAEQEVHHIAIERAKISVVVFSSNFAYSTWCLDELVKILECKESKQQIVLPIFYKVDPSDVCNLKGIHGEAFAKYEAEFKETSEEEMKVQRWKSALLEATSLAGWHITDTRDEAEAIRGITQHILKKLYGEPTQNVKAESSESRRFPHYYWTSDNQSAEQTLEEVQEDTEEVEFSKLGISKGKEIANLEPGTPRFQMPSWSSTIDNSKHDVFVSFRGTDTRYNFISHLYDSLRRAKIEVFSDKMQDKGELLIPSLDRVIERAKISVVVFSSDYASSSFCLDELVKILECREFEGQIVLPIYYKVNPSDLQKLKGIYGEAFAKSEAEFKWKKKRGEEEMKVQRWKLALLEASNLAGWHITDTCDEAGAIQGITQHILMKLYGEPTRKSKGQELITIPLVGESTAVANLMKIWTCLMHDNVSRVGIYGMGGVGKTTIVTHIYNLLIGDASPFQHVYWVTVSKESSIYELQGKIAKQIDLNLTREEDERKRAAKLWGALNSKKKFVLILDDMWESFELEEVGIPISADGGKLLLTTRAYRLCRRMQCEEIIKVEPLLEREARDLFIRESGHQIDDNPELRNLVESVVKECDGLPLAIVVIARSTRGFVENYEWRNVLKELQKSFDRHNHDMEEKVFKLLKVSYDNLQNDMYRQCLHYFALYPNDCYIDRDLLIEYWIDGELINELDSRKEEFDMGNAIIDHLINASLLEQSSSYVKMHDVVRNMVLTIMQGKLLVKAGLQLQEFPKFTDWSANLEGISIMENHSLRGCSFNSAPYCYNLRILLLQNNEKLSELPSWFFVHMRNLTILDMSGLWSLKLLPDSISKLESLRMLNLDACFSLEYIPCLVALKDLRFLKLGRTNLQKLPEGIEKLVNLRLLCIEDAKVLSGLISSKILKEFSRLQSLNLKGSNVEVKPDGVSSLQKLERLEVEFKNFEALNSYLELRHWQTLRSYFISIKNEEFRYQRSWYDMTLFWCKDRDGDCASRDGESSDFVIPFNVEHLMLMNWDSPLDGALSNGGFIHLKKLTLRKCEVNYLISVAFAQQLLQNLEELEVTECAFIVEIIGAGESLNQSNRKYYPTIKLPNLWKLCLKKLPRLRSIYKGNMRLPSLQYLKIDNCEKLERLPFHKLPVGVILIGSNFDSKLWWNSLHWDDQNHKQDLQKIFSESKDNDLTSNLWSIF